ncbi:MAG: hypothetical protein HY308_18880 [Gammaproteobacteria bacterium]|nr:hypothetical protein [Gammaproteobacteria bacterium]
MFKRQATGELVVKPRLLPRTKLLLIVGGVTVLVSAAGWFYNHGLSTAGFERSFATQAQQKLEEELQRRNAENDELRASLARAERSLQMDETAFQELDRSLKASAQEIVKLREELNFYRNIISPADKKSGLRVQSLDIQPANGANQYRYKLVLIQALKHDQTIYGSVNFQISGALGAEDKVITVPGSKVNLKYFQDIEGQFELPKDFKPRQIKVNVTPTSGAPVEQSVPWPLA